MKHFGNHLRDLSVEALAHFGAAVIQVNAAVGVDMDQRTRLIEKAGGERNAEFDRCQRQTLFQEWAAGIERLDRFTPLRVLTAGFQVGGHFIQQVVLNGLVVVGFVAFGLAVVVDFAHGQRIKPKMAGDMVHDLLDGHHALRAAKAAIRGVGGGVGLAAMAIDRGVAQVIGVVGVEHCAVDNGGG